MCGTNNAVSFRKSKENGQALGSNPVIFQLLLLWELSHSRLAELSDRPRRTEKPKSLAIWACLRVNPLGMLRIPYRGHEGKHSIKTHHAELNCLLLFFFHLAGIASDAVSSFK